MLLNEANYSGEIRLGWVKELKQQTNERRTLQKISIDLSAGLNAAVKNIPQPPQLLLKRDNHRPSLTLLYRHRYSL